MENKTGSDKISNEDGRATEEVKKTVGKKTVRKKTATRKRTIGKKAARKRVKRKSRTDERSNGSAKYPRHSVAKALRIPRAIMDQNAGKACTGKVAADFVGVGDSGPFRVEVSSAIKYGLLERPGAGTIVPSALAKQILRPQDEQDEASGYQIAVLNAPQISEVHAHYRGENLPDAKFLKNTVVDTYGVPAEKFDEFRTVFLESLETAGLITRHGDKLRVLDKTGASTPVEQRSETLKKLGKGVTVEASDSCFVMQPFSAPLGDYYEKIYKPAIEKAGLAPIRADTEIFGTGKIMDQVLRGIRDAKVLVAELTARNPNVFYELGVAHCMRKPVVLISANEDDVPFDLQHIRVIYYDVSDPFWGQKLLDKVAENIVSALRNPEEAIFQGMAPAA